MSYEYEPGSIVYVVQAKLQPKLPVHIVNRVGIVIGNTDIYPSHLRSRVLVGRDIFLLHDDYLKKV